MHPATEDIRWYRLRSKVHEDRIKRVFTLFRAEGVEPVLIKGWVAALSYPVEVPRHFNDTDIAVSPIDYEKALQVCSLDEAQRMGIDLHRGLRHLDSLTWSDLFENSRLISLDEVEIRVLRPEDHLRLMCVHWLTDGGAYKHRLWDIYYAVANRAADFDWARCLDVVSSTRRKWIIYTIGVAHKYFGLDIDDLPFKDEACQVPKWMTKCIESEWTSDIRLEPVAAQLHSTKRLLQQIWKRIPPNPIRATIELEGDLDARTRVSYQVKSFVKMFGHPLGSHRQTLERIKKTKSG